MWMDCGELEGAQPPGDQMKIKDPRNPDSRIVFQSKILLHALLPFRFSAFSYDSYRYIDDNVFMPFIFEKSSS
jgi:hypothetical protein